MVGGASISGETAENIKEKIKLAPCYGTTETAAMVYLKPKEFLTGFKNLEKSEQK